MRDMNFVGTKRMREMEFRGGKGRSQTESGNEIFPGMREREFCGEREAFPSAT